MNLKEKNKKLLEGFAKDKRPFLLCYNKSIINNSYMKINIIFFDTIPNLSQDNKKKIRLVVKKHAEKAAKILDIKLLNIVIYPKPELTIPGVGIGGFVPNAD
ncbi:MAG: hypothetical protein K9M44_02015 [Candidatus Pacebacteria bacterium]|nr:hypothetical protein [Candidatus Paceibacterota bacterium]